MQWSKLKTRVKALLEPKLAKRIDFHVTSYRKSHDECEKAWITVDGTTVFSASWYERQWGRNESRPQDFGDSLRTYLDLPVEDALKHGDALIRALAMVDRRVGKRRLDELNSPPDNDPLVHLFYKLRTGKSPAES
jgi:hypothetical protein